MPRAIASARVPRALPGAIDEFLVSGGDGRLALSEACENAYGCTPFPRNGLIDFASSTASSISLQGYARAALAREELLTASLQVGPDLACEAAVDAARIELLIVFPGRQRRGSCVLRLRHRCAVADAVPGPAAQSRFACHRYCGRRPDRQRHRLYCPRPPFQPDHLHRRHGRERPGGRGPGRDRRHRNHFPQRRSATFARLRKWTSAVRKAVEQALASHDHVLLQAMEASKFGWKAPGDALLEEIAGALAGRVQIVADACQLRTSRARLKELLSKDMLVLVTGSKFLAGPAFSGALLVPRGLAARLAAARAPVGQLTGYATRFDWPDTMGRPAQQIFPPLQFRPMAALGSRAGRDAALLCRAAGFPRSCHGNLPRRDASPGRRLTHLAFLDGGAEFAPRAAHHLPAAADQGR